MGVIRQKIIRICFIVGFIIPLFTGCNNSSSTENELPKAKSVENATKESRETNPKTWPIEKYGDPEIFSAPRLQFSWKAPGDEDRSLWSIRLDGSDLRRVLPYELLYREGRNIKITPLRSPDNRYLYISQDGAAQWPQRNLIDLKTQTVSVLASGGIVPLGTWTLDSKNLFFYCDVNLFNYNIESKVLKKHKFISSQGIHALPDGKFFALYDTGFAIHSYIGEKIKFVELGKDIHTNHTLSHDGKRLMFHNHGSECTIIEISNPKKVLYSESDFKRSASFGPKSENLFYTFQRKIYRINIKEKIKYEVFSVNVSYLYRISLVNYN